MQRSVLEASRLPPITDFKAKAPIDDRIAEPADRQSSPAATAAGGGRRMTFKSRAQGMVKLLSPNPKENERLKRELLGTQEQRQSLTEQHQTALDGGRVIKVN